MINISRILHPTDFSDNSKPALQYASELSRRFDAELHLLAVVDTRAFTGTATEPEFFPSEFIDDYIKDVEKQLAELDFNGMSDLRKVVRKTLRGMVFIEIINYARKAEIDLIVMGTHGRTGLSHLLIGSVAENVVRKASVPVLTVCPTSILKGQTK